MGSAELRQRFLSLGCVSLEQGGLAAIITTVFHRKVNESEA